MIWLVLSLLTALTVSTHDAWVKKWFSDLNVYEMAAYPLIYGLPMLLAVLWWIPVPDLDGIYLWCLVVSLPLNGASFILYMQAIKTSPLSLTIPYLAFTPVFMIFTSFLILDELPNQWGAIGILTTCLGSYVLNLENATGGLLAPVKAVFRVSGSWMMLIVAFLFSIAAVIGKKGILHSSPLFFTVSFFSLFDVLVIGSLLICHKITLKRLAERPYQGMVAGGLFFLHAVLHSFAIVLTKAAYMIAVKRLSILFSVIYGGIFFREKNMPTRILGAVCMLGGALLIILKGS